MTATREELSAMVRERIEAQLKRKTLDFSAVDNLKNLVAILQMLDAK